MSVSTEIGYQRRQFSPDTWTQEIRPIIDKQLGKWYFAFNPSLELSYHGENAGKAPGFSPNFTVGYDFTKKINGAIEYYGSLGPITGFDPLSQQEQQIFPAINLNLSPKWEINMGVGRGYDGCDRSSLSRKGLSVTALIFRRNFARRDIRASLTGNDGCFIILVPFSPGPARPRMFRKIFPQERTT